MKVAIDSDKSGFVLAMNLELMLREQGYEIEHLNHGGEYPVIAFSLAKRVAAGEFDRGILVCETGHGMAMMANKVRGIYAGTAATSYEAIKLAASNGAQIMALGSRLLGNANALCMAQAYLETPFEPRPNAQLMRDLENNEYS